MLWMVFRKFYVSLMLFGWFFSTAKFVFEEIHSLLLLCKGSNHHFQRWNANCFLMPLMSQLSIIDIFRYSLTLFTVKVHTQTRSQDSRLILVPFCPVNIMPKHLGKIYVRSLELNRLQDTIHFIFTWISHFSNGMVGWDWARNNAAILSTLYWLLIAPITSKMRQKGSYA